MTEDVHPVDAGRLRHEVKSKYREVAEDPTADFHFHTGRAHALRLGYPPSPLDQLPEAACEAFAGVANPFHWDHPQPGERIVDLGSGAGMDTFLAALWVGPTGRVIGVDMTPEMLTRSRRLADQLDLENVEFREGVIEQLPVEDGWADVVISNGVINLCPDKVGVYREVHRALRPGGRMRIADICVQRPVPEGALGDIDLWTGWIAGALPCAGWQTIIEGVGLIEVEYGPPVDTFAGASGQASARQFGTEGYPIRARKPT